MKLLKNTKFILGLFFALSLIAICSWILSIYLMHNTNPIIEPVLANTFEEKEVLTDEKIFVEVKGAVKKPGVYEVNNKTIINDVIKMAGGFTKSAWSNNINLSRKVINEMVIYVFTKSEYKSQKSKNNITKTITISNVECPSNGYVIDNCTDNNISIINPSDNIIPEIISEDTIDNTLININTASLNELISLPGIGNSKAQAIIDYRTQNGYFVNKEDIINVSGISEKIYDSIKELIII